MNLSVPGILGLPDITSFKTPPHAEDEMWTLNIQEHKADRAGLHYDVRLNKPGTSEAFSWVSKNKPLPDIGEKLSLILQPTHEASYMGWEGTLAEGYGKGTVRSILTTPVHVIESSPGKLLFNIYKGNDTARYALVETSQTDTKGHKTWIFNNYTKTTEDKSIPDYKPHYKSININEVHINRPNEILTPKIDGAHNTISLRPDKRIDVYSYRLRKNKPTRIDHTYKTDLYKYRSPKDLGETIVRAELYNEATPDNSEITSGLLNSNTWDARQKMQEQSTKLIPVIFDIVKFKGKNVEKEPYREKIRMLQEVAQLVPSLRLPEMAITPQEKLKLLDQIKSKRHPITSEGVVIYNLDTPIPVKAKQKEDFDVLITGTFPAARGSKYEGNSIGGFIGVPENGTTSIKIGTGLSDELRRVAYSNPEQFIGQWAKVEGQKQYQGSGKVRMPTFKGFRVEKYK